jgi:hypothetical protein
MAEPQFAADTATSEAGVAPPGGRLVRTGLRVPRLPVSLGLPVAAACAALAGYLLLPEWSLGVVARELCALCQEQPVLYWGPGWAALALLIVQVVLPFALPGVANRKAGWSSRTAFVLLVLATVVLLRWPGLAPLELNQDESNELAVALALRDDPRYLVSTEYGTHGPLVAFALLPVQLVGMQLDYASARLVGLALLLACIFFQFGMLRTFFSEPISRAVVMPLTICIAFLRDGRDCIAYNAEHPAVFLLCAAGYACARLAAGPARGAAGRALAAGLVLGLVPFAKLQAVPMALVLAAIALACLLVRSRGRGRQRAALWALAAGGLAPASLVALYLWSRDLFLHFRTSYIGVNLALASDGLCTYAEQAWEPEMLIKELCFPYFLGTSGAGLCLLGLLRRAGRCWWLFLGDGAVLLAGLYSVFAPGFPFGHYLLFLLFPLAFLSAAVLATLLETLQGRGRRLALVGVCLAAAVTGPVARARDEGNRWLGTEPAPDYVADLIRRYASPGEKLVVWGWMDRYYVLTGLRPGALHPNTYWEIASAANSPLGHYFYRLFLDRFDHAKPPVFVDAVNPESFYFNDPDQFAHEHFPELRDRIATRYVLVGDFFSARVYVAKERLAALPPTHDVPVSVRPSAVDRMQWKDGSGTGDGAASSLVFALPKPQWVTAVRITCAYEATGSPARLRMFWKRSDQQDFTEDQKVTLEYKPEPGTQTLTLPVKDTIAQIRIHPDNKPHVFTIKELVLQMPFQLVSESDEYQLLIERVRDTARTALPAGATVLVVSKGDEDLVQLPGRRGWHFPQDSSGTYQGFNPGDSAEAIAQLESLRKKGAQFLLLPEPYFWWLTEYVELKRHLEAHYRLVVRKDDVCLIFDLR